MNPTDPDYWQKLEAEVAWARAEKLDVTVAFPNEWGASPNFGTNRCYDITRTNETPRQGYTFYVEFTQSSGFGFVKWLAFNSNEYETSILNADLADIENNHPAYLSSSIVSIEKGETTTGAITAFVKINDNIPVTLVPWCSDRPRLDARSNPPLNPIQASFPFDQTVNLWFTMPIKQQTAVLGDTIHISAIHIADTATKKRGEKYGIDGDITDYFERRVLSGTDNRIDLVPTVRDEYPLEDLALLNISVSVGPGIESVNGIKMGETQILSYNTDTSKVQEIYRPGIIQASRTLTPLSDYFQDGLNYSNPTIDRRFKSNDTVYIRFSVTAPDDAPLTPNKITVIEDTVFTLRGSNPPGGGSSPGTQYNLPDDSVTLSDGFYTITHSIKTTTSGIIRLVVLPEFDDADAPVPLPHNIAVMEGFYVTIVLDLAPPDLENPNIILSAPGSIDEEVYVYGKTMPFSLTIGGLANLIDNGIQGGIPASSAWSSPWTMDDVHNLYWYAQIGEDDGENTITSPRLNVYNGSVLNNTWTPSGGCQGCGEDCESPICLLTDEAGYRVLIKYEDKMGNISPDWIDKGFKIKYIDYDINSVKDLKATVNPDGNSIEVSWENTGEYQSAEFTVRRYRASSEGEIFDNYEDTISVAYGTSSFGFEVSAIPQRAIDGVKDGNSITGVYGYEISAVTKNIAGDSEKVGPIWIYNIPNMVTTGTGTGTASDTFKLNRGNFTSANLTASDITNYILTSDVSLGEWSHPSFTGRKFYGCGNAVYVSDLANTTNIGLFGSVSGANTEIRDLTVVYNSKVTIETTTSSNTRMGGLAGNVQSGAKLRNIIVRGSGSLEYTYTGTTAKLIYFGGVAGELNGTGTLLENVYAAIDMNLSSTGADSAAYNVRIGGVVGYLYNASITGARWIAGTKLDVKQCNGRLYAGGIAGWFNTNNSSNINPPAISNTNSYGDISVNSAHRVQLGGLVGQASGDSPSRFLEIKDCSYEIGIITATVLGVVDGYNIDIGDSSNSVDNTGIGGLIGTVGLRGGKGPEITDCKTNAESIEVMFLRNTNIALGGFAGIVFDTEISGGTSSSPLVIHDAPESWRLNTGGFIGFFHSLNAASRIERCDSTSSISVNAKGRSEIALGGLIGYIYGYNATNNATMYQCSASGDLSSKSGLTLSGGLVGYMRNAKIEQCMATGNVYAETRPDKANGDYVLVGGLIGYGSTNAELINSYALGNVEVNDPFAGGNYIGAGGIIGRSVSSTSITRCFSKGNVIIHANTGKNIFAGGIVGTAVSTETLTNCVALNEYVYARGGNIRSAARIYAELTNNRTGTNNYALNQMYLETWDVYRNPSSSNITAVTPVSNLTGPHGADVTATELATEAWWTDAARGFTAANGWSMTGIARGYPRLAWEFE